MEQLLFALIALLGSSLTAAYITNSWQRAKHDADSLDERARGIFEHHGRFRMILGKAYSVLYIQKALGGVSIAEKQKLEEASGLCFEAIADLDREKLRMLAFDPSREASLNVIMASAIAAGNPIETVQFIDINRGNPNTCVHIQLPGRSIDEAMAAINAVQPQLSDQMVAFAKDLAASRQELLRNAWRIRKGWGIAASAVFLFGCCVYVQFGAKQLVVTDGQIFRYSQFSGRLDKVPTTSRDGISISPCSCSQSAIGRVGAGAMKIESARECSGAQLGIGHCVACPGEAARGDSLR
jgi:hypothetical protein